MKQKSISKLKEEVWKWFALYIKLKYSEDGKNTSCFTCGAPLVIGTSNCQAGYYYSKKAFPALYFNENNVRATCFHCNHHLMGNPQIYREKLIEEIGEEGVAELDKHRHDNIKWSRTELIELAEHYKEKVNERS